ncbi:hypothetical protein [Corynebacterium ureicelerivorans]|uniref:hypothetical protein n=1 Tax=Corynebacterium ureicelerivorans TaxID=401472 RepID=UPI00205B29A7|nr:hypothetical protein [Corynebacterium ureicelerivorans]DAI67996.1 MAG TPA: hypothetical protein [Caudoviricetes sp.]
MSNIDKAAQIIRDSSEVDGETLGYAHSHNIANDLADAGLIAPDLPKPDAHGDWELAGGVTVTADDGEITITEPLTDEHTMICWYGQPHNARELADALHAAAQHAEADQ